jgi:DNA-binding NarL/FixJ family response regulator
MATHQEVTNDGTKKRVLIVDDHPIVRQGLKGLISQAPDLTVCGEAETIFDALKAIEELKPDVAVVDISLDKGESGVDLIKDIRIRYPDLPVLTLSMYDEAIYAERVLRAGGRGYVTKDEAAEHVLQAIRQVLKGQIFLSERMSAKMLSKLVGGRTEAAGLSVDRLSDRELQIFELIGRGMSTRMIAETLHLSIKTIESHRANIKEKLQVDNTTELLQQAIHWLQSQG